MTGRYDTRTQLESLLKPSKVVSDQYAPVMIATLGGRVLTGVVKDLTGKEWAVTTDPFDPARLVDAFAEAEALEFLKSLRAGSRTGRCWVSPFRYHWWDV